MKNGGKLKFKNMLFNKVLRRYYCLFSKILNRKEAENLIWDQLKFLHNQAFLPIWEFEPEMEFVKYFAVSFQEKDGSYLDPFPYAEEHAAFIHDPENKDLKDKSFQNIMFEKYPQMFLESYALVGFISLEVKKYGVVGRKYLVFFHSYQ